MYKKHKQYRLPSFDYASNGYYFITICTKDKEHYLGEIKNKEITLFFVGEFVLNNILQFCPTDNVENPYKNNPFLINNADTIFGITEWEILPNHIHLIVEVINNTIKVYKLITGLAPLTKGSVSLFINHFKGHVTKFCKLNNIADFNGKVNFMIELLEIKKNIIR